MERLLVVLGLSGCSFALSGPDPHRPRSEAPKCDTGKGLVALDAVVATGLGIGAIAALNSDTSTLALLPLALGAAFVGAAIHGSSEVDKCRAAMGEYEMARQVPPVAGASVAEVMQPRPLPLPLPQPQPQPLPQPQPQPQPQPLPQLQPQPQPQPQPLPQLQPQPQPQPQPQRQPRPQPQPAPEWSSFWKEAP